MKTRTTKGQWKGKRADGRACVVLVESEWELVGGAYGGADATLPTHVTDWISVDGLPANFVEKGKYQLASGEIVTSADPDAP